ncbi:M23 family metallopeptidase [Pontibacter sp. G13]|uniref:M23 family metallopeptidase n=1 Tax=Pontibacter sp. G13 TaxID=3074898 RepID=UPI00288B948E|nr:M23 family metallopeptidase [Pontibacter sp. G13]WNJ18130.1 M23 family metallopeptidase [Pontibacter sp. G13]
MKSPLPLCFLLLWLGSCHTPAHTDAGGNPKILHQEVVYAHLADSVFAVSEESSIADRWDFPVGKPDAKGYYDAQPFGRNVHLGEDWNAVTGGDSDLGDTIYAAANGWVYSARHEGAGWGNILRVIHRGDSTAEIWYESFYAHCDTMLAIRGDWVSRGQPIATIGNADGAYWAHLHFELRTLLYQPIGGGYGSPDQGQIPPTPFIQTHR